MLDVPPRASPEPAPVEQLPRGDAPPPSDEPTPDALRIEQVCADSRARVLDAIAQYQEIESGRPATLADLHDEPPTTEEQVLGGGVGYWGPKDIDGDGVDDRVFLFTTIDFWGHFLFLQKGGCLRYAGSLDGYQVAITRANGAISAIVNTYPIGPNARIIAYAWNGAFFQPRSP